MLIRGALVAYTFLVGGEALLGGADHSQYELLAQNLVAHHAFSLSTTTPFLPDVLRTPGYPLFLALSYILTQGFLYAALVQVFLGALIPVGVRYIGIKLGLSSRTAMVAALLTLCDLTFLSNTASIQTEGLFVPLFLGMVVVSMTSIESPRLRDALLLGGWCGGLALIRPVFWYVGIGWILLWAFLSSHRGSRARIQLAGAGLVALALVVSPWIIRNYTAFHTPTLSSIGPVNMYTRLAVSVLSVQNHTPFPEQYVTSLTALAHEGKIPSRTYPRDEGVLYDAEYQPLFIHETLTVLREYPLAFVKVALLSVVTLLTHDNTLNVLQTIGIAPLHAYPPFSVTYLVLTRPLPEVLSTIGSVMNGWYLIPYIGRAFWFVIVLGALSGWWVLWRASRQDRTRRARLLFVTYLVGAFIVVTLPVGFSIDARMRVPIEPFLLILGSVGGAALWRSISSWRMLAP